MSVLRADVPQLPIRARDPDAHQAAARHGGRTVVTLSPPVAEAVREMAETMGHDVSNAEVVRRGLILLDFLLHLADHEELGVRNRETDEWERIRFAWGPVTARRRGQGNQ